MLVECPSCEAIVDGEVIASYVNHENQADMDGLYSFLKCPRCANPFLMLQIDDSGFETWDEPRRLYPPLEMGVSLAIPNSLRLAYDEAHSCFKAKAYTATAIMCRKTLEGIADESKITARNLATALKEMKEKGIIENRLYEWADTLRISGNEAAHGVNSRLSRQDAKDILEFTHAILEYVFTFQEKFEQFKNRQNQTNSKTTA
jgi:uncharacterized C2H2 Zn-finger protein